MEKRLKYEKINNCDNVISIDLHNDYSIIAVTGYGNEGENSYTTTLFIKYKDIDTWRMVSEGVFFETTSKTINSAILKHVSFLLENGNIDKYIDSYSFEIDCLNRGIEIAESEMCGN